MDKKWQWIGTSCIGAGLLFGLLLIVGNEGGIETGTRLNLGTVDDDGMDVPILSGQGDNYETEDGSIVLPMNQGSYEDLEIGYGQLRGSLTDDKMTLKRVRVTLTINGGRMLLIDADEAEIYNTQGRPSRGDFTGNVKISMLKKAKGFKLSKSLSPSNPALSFQGTLDAIHFDLELNSISSEGKVVFESRKARFDGTGLELNYNNHEERIEKFEIKKGKTIRIAGGMMDKGQSEEPADNLSEKANTSETKQHDKNAKTQKITQYIFRLANGITFSRKQKNKDIIEVLEFKGGERLDALFTNLVFENEDNSSTKSKNNTDNNASQGKDEAGDLDFVDQGGKLFSDASDDFVMQWAGNLLIEPTAIQDKAKLKKRFGDKSLLDDRDLVMILGGENAEMTVDRGNEKMYLKATDFVFHKTIGQIGAHGTATAPVVYVGAGNFFTGRGFWYRKETGEARMVGPGVLKMQGMLADGALDKTGVSKNAKMKIRGFDKVLSGDPVTVAFKQWVHVDFYDKNEVAGNEQLIKQLTFKGAFDVDHALFGLAASEGMVADFVKVNEGKKGFSSRLVKMDAAGIINGRYAKSDRKTAFSARKKLLVEFDYGKREGESAKMFPKTLLAIKDVTFGLGIDQGLDDDDLDNKGIDLLEANGKLFVVFEKPNFSGWVKDDNTQDKAELVPVKTIQADGGVMMVRGFIRKYENGEIDDVQEKMSVVADHLIGSVRKGEFKFWGNDEMLAQIVLPGFKLQGEQITLKRQKQWMDVLGKGILTYTKVEDQAQQEATIKWSKRMHLDNLNGRALFSGDVKSRYQQGRFEVTEMNGKRMDLWFDPIDKNKKSEAKNETNSFETDRFFKSLNKLELLNGGFEVAQFREDHLKFQADDLGRFISKISGKGKKIIFINAGDAKNETDRKEQFTIRGKGSEFTVLDNKLAAFKHGQTKDHITMQGAGQTRFDFDGQMLVDILKNVARIDKKVVMKHIPLKQNGQRISIKGHLLTAKISDIGGLGGLMRQWQDNPQANAKAPQKESDAGFELKNVTVESIDLLKERLKLVGVKNFDKWLLKSLATEKEGRLIIRTGNEKQEGNRLIEADRMYFDAAQNTTLITPRQGVAILLYEDAEGNTNPSKIWESIEWTLGRNRLDIKGLGGGSTIIE